MTDVIILILAYLNNHNQLKDENYYTRISSH
jgi:hypothetical protein